VSRLLASKLLREPPITVTSSAVKSVTASEITKSTSAVSPTLSRDVLVDNVTVGAVRSTVLIRMVTTSALLLVLPAESEKLPAATATVPVVSVCAAGTKTAVYSVGLLAVKFVSSPPFALRSSTPKSSELSDSVTVMVSVVPGVRVLPLPLVARATVGAWVSTAIGMLAPSLLVVPAASLKAPAATETPPSVVVSGVGVKMAE